MTAIEEPPPVVAPQPKPEPRVAQSLPRPAQSQRSPVDVPPVPPVPVSSPAGEAPPEAIRQTPAPRPTESAPPPPAPVSHAPKAEDVYIGNLRAYLNSIKRYPTGRQASIQKPRGNTRVWFVLSRDGRLQDAGIDESSDSLLLDRTAIATVQRGGFPSFPDAAWSGLASHRFVVELEFVPGG